VFEEHGYALVESLVFATAAIAAITGLALPIFVQERKLLALNQLALSLSRSYDLAPDKRNVQLIADELRSRTLLAGDAVLSTLTCTPADCDAALARRVFTLVDGNLVAQSFAING
jgi:hypothetical protein